MKSGLKRTTAAILAALILAGTGSATMLTVGTSFVAEATETVPVITPTGNLETVYLNGSAGNDSNDGTETEQAVKTLGKALALVKENGTVIVTGSVTLNSSTSFCNVTIERGASYQGILFTVSGAETVVTLNNTIIDGKNYDVNAYAYLVEITGNATLNIGEDTELKNNQSTAVSVLDGCTLNLNGGKIHDNTSTSDAGGIYIWKGTVHLNSGIISKNHADLCGGGICNLSGTVTLDNVTIENNTSNSRGAGIYVEGQGQSASFTMNNGSITNNSTMDGQGPGVCAVYYDADTTVTINGGTISENRACWSDDSSVRYENAILINDLHEDVAAQTPFATLQLSGSPQISGEVTLCDWVDYGPHIDVIGAFTPVYPITVDDIYGTPNRVVVSYAAGISPNPAHFAFDPSKPSALIPQGQNLVWTELAEIRFYQYSDTDTYPKTTTVYTFKNEPIPSQLVPEPIATNKTGYTRTGWMYQSNDTWNLWKMDSNVPDEGVRLYEVWSLNPATVSITADKTSAVTGESITLTANASHEIDAPTYTYQWYKDDVEIPNAIESNLVVKEAGNYTVKVTVSDGKLTTETTQSAPALTFNTPGGGGTVTPPEPEKPAVDQVQNLKAVKKSTGWLKLNFDQVEGADGYEIYNAETNEKLADCTTQNGRAVLTKTVTGLNKGTTYKLQVRAYKLVDGEKVYGEASQTYTKATAYLDKVTGVKPIKKTQTTLKIQFNKVEGAERYKIFDAETGKMLCTVSTQGGADVLKKTITGLNAGEERQYKVRAYATINGKSEYGEFSKTLVKKTAV